MARPKSANPKSAHIGIATTPELKERFNALNLKGDKAIEVLLYYLENDNRAVQLDKIRTVNKLKEIDKQIENLEFEKFRLQEHLEEVNKKIGLAESGATVDVEKAINVVIQRFEKQNLNILDFLAVNEELLKQQAYLCGIDYNKLGDLVFDKV